MIDTNPRRHVGRTAPDQLSNQIGHRFGFAYISAKKDEPTELSTGRGVEQRLRWRTGGKACNERLTGESGKSEGNHARYAAAPEEPRLAALRRPVYILQSLNDPFAYAIRPTLRLIRRGRSLDEIL